MYSELQIQNDTMKEQKQSKASIMEVDSSEISEMIDDLNYTVRCKSFKELEDDYKNKIDGEFSALELSRIAKNLFSELENKYGIKTPVEFFISRDESDKQVLYSKVDIISGSDLSKKDSLKKNNQPIKKLYSSLSQYFLDKLNNGGFFLTDISDASQYVYGEKSVEFGENDANEQIYLIDTDIYLDNRRESLMTVVYWLSMHFGMLEYNRNVSVPQVKDNIKKFIKEYQKKFPNMNSKNRKRLEEVEKLLAGSEPGEAIMPAIPTFEE